MSGNIYVYGGSLIGKVGNHQDGLGAVLAYKRILALQMAVGIHQVEHLALRDSLLLLCQRHHLAIHIVDILFADGIFAVSRTHHGVHAPVVENGGSSVAAAKALLVHTTLAILLSEVNHQRVLLQQGRYH